MTTLATYQVLADRFRDGDSLTDDERGQLLGAAVEHRNYLMIDRLTEGETVLLDARQMRLVQAISSRLSDSGSHADLLVAAAREAKMTRIEAVLVLDQLTLGGGGVRA